jgi:two-component system sensor histidine kinase DegS
MTEANANLDKLIKTARELLAANEANLKALSDQVGAYLAANGHAGMNGRTEANGRQSPLENLQHLQQQIDYLTHHSKKLETFLTSHSLDILPKYPLSRIQILQQQEEERARTARDLEDSVGQLLANAIFELAAVKQLVTSEDNLDELMSGITALQEELEAGLADLRFLIADLEPATTLGNFGLIAGLRRYLEKFSEQTKLQIDYQPQIVLEPIPDTIELAIFRIIQEALQNIYLHARATQIQVIISEEQSDLKFTVIDNGTGLSHTADIQNHRRLGLVGMKDLADLLDGDIQLKSEPGKGTQITLTIPYPQF